MFCVWKKKKIRKTKVGCSGGRDGGGGPSRENLRNSAVTGGNTAVVEGMIWVGGRQELGDRRGRHREIPIRIDDLNGNTDGPNT